MNSSGGSPIRFMALDYGQSRIGVAVSDELGLMAHPRAFIPAKPPGRALRFIKAQVAEESIAMVLIGLPLNMDGSEGLSARRARKFAAEVESAAGVQIEFVDERLTTKAAQGLLHAAGRKEKDSRAFIDSASAAVILQGWLDSKRTEM